MGGADLSKDARPGPGSYEAATDFYDYDGGTDPSNPRHTHASSEPRPPKGRGVRVPSFVFKSATAKDIVHKNTVKQNETKPPPGAYDPVHIRDAPQVVRLPPGSEGFLSANPRFDYSVKFHTPGPDSYNPADATGGKRMNTFNRTVIEGIPQSGRPKMLGFSSQDPRFKSSEKLAAKTAPGPGEYNTDPNWITRTHNVYFGDLV